jgi:dCMP deaminase
VRHRWLKEFVDLAYKRAEMSRDENTHVGAVIFSEEDCVEISVGYNCLARGVEHKPERNQRPLKYLYTSHAEASAVANAARLGRSTKGASLVATMFPCPLCAALLINAGVKKVYCPPPDWEHYKYKDEFEHSLVQFKEAGVDICYLEQE